MSSGDGASGAGVAPPPPTSPSTPTPLRLLPRTVIYRARFMVPIRALVRFKLFHLAAAAIAAGPAASAVAGAAVPGAEVVLAAAAVGACGGGAAALTWLSRRYVGELSLLVKGQGKSSSSAPPPGTLIVSTLDGWGNRADTAVAVRDVIPPLAGLGRDAAAAAAAARPLLALDIAGGATGGGDGRRQLLVSLTHAAFLDRETMMALMVGGGDGTGGL